VIIMNWDRDPILIEQKLAKAYGPHPAPGGWASRPEATYRSTGMVLTIEDHRKSEVQAKLTEAASALAETEESVRSLS
jgi:hypothetical protein